MQREEATCWNDITNSKQNQDSVLECSHCLLPPSTWDAVKVASQTPEVSEKVQMSSELRMLASWGAWMTWLRFAPSSSVGHGLSKSRITAVENPAAETRSGQPCHWQWRPRLGVGRWFWLWTDSAGPPRLHWAGHQEIAAQARGSKLCGRQDKDL